MNTYSRLRRALCTAALGLAAVTALPGTALANIQIGATSSPKQTTAGVFPVIHGYAAAYHFVVPNGSSLTDTIPVEICATGQEGSTWTSDEVKFTDEGGSLPSGITTPGNVKFTPSTVPSCKTVNVQIATPPLTLADPDVGQVFTDVVTIRQDNPQPGGGINRPQFNWTGTLSLHLRIHVQPSNLSCFITDSSGLLLTKCDGTLADKSGSDEGRFAIVANKKGTENATNPGQFYYNLIYHNPGSDPITVDVGFVRDGVSPKGAQAIHAALFAPPFSGYTQEGFDTVNNGIPEGTDDQALGISIPGGWTLWVTYHLDWNGLGSAVPPGCATSCETANQGFTVTGTVTPTVGSPESCTAGAWGYKK